MKIDRGLRDVPRARDDQRSRVCSSPYARVSTWAPSARTARRRSPPIRISNRSSATRPRPPRPSCSRSRPSRFVDPQARQAFIEMLDRDEVVTDHLIRVRRVDGTPIWIEVSATASHRPMHPNQTQTRRAARRSAHPRRQRAQEARRSKPRRPLPDAAGREDGRARPDHLGRRARAEQPARDDPLLGRASLRAQRRRQDEAGPRGHPRRIRARRAHRPQPADVRAQAPDHARDGRSQPDRARNARAARLRTTRLEHQRRRSARHRPAGCVCRRPSDQAGPAQPDHQRRAGLHRRQRHGHHRRAHLARHRSRLARARSQ